MPKALDIVFFALMRTGSNPPDLNFSSLCFIMLPIVSAVYKWSSNGWPVTRPRNDAAARESFHSDLADGY